MVERCSYCGRFMKQVWFQSSDEPDSWQDYSACSLDSEHAKAFPEHYGLDPEPDDIGTNDHD